MAAGLWLAGREAKERTTLISVLSALRTPSIRIDGADGKEMEMNPRPVDVTVERLLGETLAGKDSQLDAAVAELLKGLGPKR